MTSTSQFMKVSRNGQVSIPAAVRARWQADEVIVVDMGGYVMIRPRTGDPVTDLKGIFARPGIATTDRMRRQDRDDDAAREDRALGH